MCIVYKKDNQNFEMDEARVQAINCYLRKRKQPGLCNGVPTYILFPQVEEGILYLYMHARG